MRQIAASDFAATALSRADAEKARFLLGDYHKTRLIKHRSVELAAIKDASQKGARGKGTVRAAGTEMKFLYRTFGESPPEGRRLFLSMHGGGGAPTEVNDQQWNAQIDLYQPEEGIYVAPRAPTDTWDLWHQGHIDPLFDRLIENMVLAANVDPNKVYLMGYSAGGDGVYQLAPRMSDRWAAAAMMAGHPNETTPEGLRNVPFALQVGGKDSAYNRNVVAKDFSQQIDKLRQEDSTGYESFVKIYPDKGHWMDLQDAVGVPWMAEHVRNPKPTRLVWKQDDVTHQRFYWCSIDSPSPPVAGTVLKANIDGQTISITLTGDIKKLTLHLDDSLINLDKDIQVLLGEDAVFEGQVRRQISALAADFEDRYDPHLAMPALLSIEVPDE